MKDRTIPRAERLRSVISMPEYADTVGLWIDEARKQALHDMTSATELHDFHRAQGAYKAIQDLTSNFEAVFSAEKATILKNEKKRE